MVHRFGVLTANNIVRVRVLSMAMSSMSIYDVVCRIIWVWCKYHEGGGLGASHGIEILVGFKIV